jgi:hypothetical protein
VFPIRKREAVGLGVVKVMALFLFCFRRLRALLGERKRKPKHGHDFGLHNPTTGTEVGDDMILEFFPFFSLSFSVFY